jgi:hypothetical protein
MISGSAPPDPAAASSRDQYWKARPQPGSITDVSFALPGRGVGVAGVAPLGRVADGDTKIEGAATEPRTVTDVGATCGEAGGADDGAPGTALTAEPPVGVEATGVPSDEDRGGGLDVTEAVGLGAGVGTADAGVVVPCAVAVAVAGGGCGGALVGCCAAPLVEGCGPSSRLVEKIDVPDGASGAVEGSTGGRGVGDAVLEVGGSGLASAWPITAARACAEDEPSAPSAPVRACTSSADRLTTHAEPDAPSAAVSPAVGLNRR